MLQVALVTILAREMRLKFLQVDQRLEMLRVPLVTILAREMRLNFFWSRPTFGDVASAASHDIGARNAIEIFWSRPTFGDVASGASHDIGARIRNAIEFFEVDQRLEMLRVPLVTILAREMRLKFFEVDQALEMLRVALVTILAREMRLKFFWSRPTFGDVASGASHDIGARNAIEIFWKFFEVDRALEMLRVPLVTTLAREMRFYLFFWSRPTFGDVASGASHDIGARNAIETFLKSTNVWRCCECRWSRYWREKCDSKFFEVDQRLEMLRVPLVTI